MARVHRDGQKRPVHIYRYVRESVHMSLSDRNSFLATGMMDEKVYQRQIQKIGLSSSLMDDTGTSKGGKDGDSFTHAEVYIIMLRAFRALMSHSYEIYFD